MAVKSRGIDLSAFWPIGSVYMSVLPANPQITLGFGSWVAFGAGRVPVGVDPLDPDFDTPEETGGEKAHTLTIAEIPSHNHTYTAPNAPVLNLLVGTSASVTGVNNAATTGSTGGGAAHNNLQPYIVVYMWKRVA